MKKSKVKSKRLVLGIVKSKRLCARYFEKRNVTGYKERREEIEW